MGVFEILESKIEARIKTGGRRFRWPCTKFTSPGMADVPDRLSLTTKREKSTL